MGGKIIQIMPAPENLFCIYEDEAGKIKSKVLCLALTNKGEILLMDMYDDGCIDEITASSNFKKFTWERK